MTRKTQPKPTLKRCRALARRFVAEHIKANRPWHIGTLAHYMPIDYTLSASATEFADAPTVENITRWMRSNAETDR